MHTILLCITYTTGYTAPISNTKFDRCSTVGRYIEVLAWCRVGQENNNPTTTFAPHRKDYVKRFTHQSIQSTYVWFATAYAHSRRELSRVDPVPCFDSIRCDTLGVPIRWRHDSLHLLPCIVLIRGTLLIPPDAGPLAVAPDVLYKPPCLQLPNSTARQPHGKADDLGPRYNYLRWVIIPHWSPDQE